jgi:SAM-dependent methyltransferase
VQDWTKDFFSAGALDAWRRAQTSDITQAEVEFLVETLELGDEPKRLLDVPCGDARHAVELAALGHHVTAVDRALDNQTLAKKRAADAGVTLEFVLSDMRSLPAADGLDGAYCWGNSFGYFPQAEMSLFCSQVAQRLASGARFVIDTATCAESLLLELERRSWVQVDEELVLLLECAYDARESRLDTTYTSVLRDQVVDRRTAHHFVFTSAQLVGMLEGAGFEAVALYGDLDGSAFELGCERLLAVAQRK